MKKGFLYTLIATMLLSATLSGCGAKDVTPTPEPTEKPVAVVPVLDEYYLISGHYKYHSKDGAYSILLPDECRINDEDVNNVTVSIDNEYGQVDNIFIKFDPSAQMINTESLLMEKLKDDDSIDITGFFLLMHGNECKGYQYTCTSVNDPNFKTIKCVYMSTDGSAYELTASTPNGDDVNMQSLKTIVETFVNYK